MTAGSIALSTAGHDKGLLHMVMAVDGGFTLIADGKCRKVDAPKRKNPKHLAAMPCFGKFQTGVTNRELRKIIAECKAELEGERV